MAKPLCAFCRSETVKLLYKDTWHPVARDHGPFDFYTCNNCSSGFTYPLPSAAQLTDLYNRFSEGIIPATQEIREAYPMDAWYRQCLQRTLKQSGRKYDSSTSFSWIDLGAGKGEMSKLVCREFPKSLGLGVDFHTRPKELESFSNLNWRISDLNEENFSANLPGAADLIFMITVLEHVRQPDIFLANALRLLKPGGCLYLTTPRFDSFASKVLGRRWPYIIPGEHLNMPSIRGMEIMTKRIVEDLAESKNFKIQVSPVVIPYAAGYYAKHFGLHFLTPILPKKLLLKMPTGILEASILAGG